MFQYALGLGFCAEIIQPEATCSFVIGRLLKLILAFGCMLMARLTGYAAGWSSGTSRRNLGKTKIRRSMQRVTGEWNTLVRGVESLVVVVQDWFKLAPGGYVLGESSLSA
jgi:hypothetical protein